MQHHTCCALQTRNHNLTSRRAAAAHLSKHIRYAGAVQAVLNDLWHGLVTSSRHIRPIVRPVQR